MLNWGRVKEIRESRGMTSQQLADRSGLSRTFVGMVEGGRANPSIESISKLATALDMPDYMLLKELRSPDGQPPPTPPKGRVVRKAERKLLTTGENRGRVTQLLTPDLQGALQVTLVQDTPHYAPPFERVAHEGEECGYVLAGSYEIIVGDERHILEEGDSITLDATIPHVAREIGDTPGCMLWSCTPPWI